VEVSAYADLAVVKADRRALRSILDNLLSNAMRYTPEEGEILLAAEEIKDFVQFTVRDTGRGIEAERLSTIFDRFNPFSESGTGLGLALVRRLVESLGGQIAVESRLGHGTTFRFSLPVAVASESASRRGGLSDGRDHSRKSRNPPGCASTLARRRAWARPTTC
jgi:NtrC-family two-component system sensor histidine kinase KinB